MSGLRMERVSGMGGKPNINTIRAPDGGFSVVDGQVGTTQAISNGSKQVINVT